MARLFIEISCEEIPARMQARAIRDLADMLSRQLQERGFGTASCRSVVSPRHMAVELDGLNTSLPESQTEKRGPRADAPDKAIDGFCHSVGVSRTELELRQTDKGSFYFAVITQQGVELEDILEELVQQVISQFPWPKSQRWAETSLSWVRPLRGLSVSLDGRPLSGSIKLSESEKLAYQQQTIAHPFYDTKPVTITDFDSYCSEMRAGYVLVDHEERKAEIERQMTSLADMRNLSVIPDAGLLEEITGLVEWPSAICGTIDDSFMALPPEVLITSMRVHQKFFALSSSHGKMAPAFITVANRKTDNAQAELIRAGNERVLRARLSDAAFFYDQDRATSLQAKIPQLAHVTFYEGLGSLQQKAQRLAELASWLAEACGADKDTTRRAGQLAKADLVSGMVGEFPELQGIMGGYYAAHDGEDERVCSAISDHYRPAGPADRVPNTPEGQAVSLADKIDTLVGFFGIGAKPTGSRDPYALRRAALGILRIIDEADLDIDINQALLFSAQLYGHKDVDSDLPSFICDRLRVSLRDRQIAHDVVAAVVTAGDDSDQISALLSHIRLTMRRAEKLHAFLATGDGADFVAGWRRVSSLLAAEEKKGELPALDISEALFELPAETQLYAVMNTLGSDVITDLDMLDQRLDEFSQLAAPINRFFDDVVVMTDNQDVQTNRLMLLVSLRQKMRLLADFSQLEG